MCVWCSCVSLTGCHGLRVAVVVVVIQAKKGGHTSGGAQALSQVGGSWVVGVHAVLRGHVVARQAAVTMGHLLNARREKNTINGNNDRSRMLWITRNLRS